VHEDPRCSAANEMWEEVEHTEAVLADLLGSTTAEIGRPERDGVVRCAHRPDPTVLFDDREAQ
jgi:hypothetical protein